MRRRAAALRETRQPLGRGAPLATLAVLAALAGPAHAGQQSGQNAPPQPIHGPPPPVPPATIARDAANQATVRAVRLTAPLDIDGNLDEQVYNDLPPASGFIQILPDEGDIATEQTEVWVLFDDDNLYVSARCFNSAPESEWVASDMRRDGMGLGQYVGIVLDTFYDRRNAVEFVVNPIGGRMDGEISNERGWNQDWNPVWSVEVGRFDGGWTFEAVIPFKSLRYRPGRRQTWGFNIERRIVWNNEYSALVPLPASLSYGAIMQISQAATLVGLEVPDAGINLELKPYAIAELNGVRTAAPRFSNIATGDIGLDVKYGVTDNLVADLTVNTDFAQVEADEQQINLTRFSLFFPEKREFFLENQGVFSFGGEAGAGQFAGISNTPILFYSRRIGLHATEEGVTREVPIDAGGRFTGRIGKYSLGLLNIRTADAPAAGAQATSFSVLRLRRDLLRRSNVGVMFTDRSVSLTGRDRNQVFGVDGLFSFYQNLNIRTYWAATRTGRRDAGRRRVEPPGAARLHRRPLRRATGAAGRRRRLQPRDRLPAPRRLRAELRQVPLQPAAAVDRGHPPVLLGGADSTTSPTAAACWRRARARGGVSRSSSRTATLFDVIYNRNYEYLVEPFPLAAEVVVPVGGYDLRRRGGGLPARPAEPRLRPRLAAARRVPTAGRRPALTSAWAAGSSAPAWS